MPMTKTVSSTVNPEPIKRGGRWLPKLAIAVAALFALLMVVYFVVTSGAFFKGIILPRIGRAIGADFSVADASISPFKRIVLRGLRVQLHGQQPLLAAAELRADYSLFAVMRGTINIAELTFERPELTVVQNADGTSNLDPIRNALAKKPAPPVERKPAKPLQLDIGTIAIKDGAVRLVMRAADGRENVFGLTNLAVTIAGVKNGEVGKVTLGTKLCIEQNHGAQAIPASLCGKVTGEFDFGLSHNLQPQALHGMMRVDATDAGGTLSEFGSLHAELNCDVTPGEVKELALRFSKADVQLGQVRITGPIDLGKRSADLRIAVLNLDRHVLNIVGAPAGLDFGTTTFNSTNRVQVTAGGMTISVIGQCNVEQFMISRAGQSTPVSDLLANYNLVVDRAAAVAELQRLDVTGTQRGRTLVDVRLTKPMTIAWGTTSSTLPDSALQLRVEKLDLADWKPFVGQVVPGGKIDLQAQIASEQAGKVLRFELVANGDALELLLGTNRVGGLNLGAEIRGELKALNQITLGAGRAQVALRGHEILALSGVGNFDIAKQLGEAQLRLTGAMPAVASVLATGAITFSAGTFALEAHYTQKMQAQQLAGTLQLDSIAGRAGQSTFSDLDATAEFNLGHDAGRLEFKPIKCTIFQAQKPCGTVELSARYDLRARSGEATLHLTGLTERALAPALEPVLKEAKLASVTLNCAASAKLEAGGGGTLKADLLMTNLVVARPQGKEPTPPIEARLLIDALVRTQFVELRQCELALSPTARAKNRLSAIGMIDFSKRDGITGRLKLAAEALDLTPYYETFAGERLPKQPKPDTAPARQQQEPAPIRLPLDDFNTEIAVEKIYLREIEVADLQCNARIRGGRVLLDPVRFALNGGLVNAQADLDLGVPGYKYELNLSAAGVPLAPLADSFSADYRRAAAGALYANAHVKGAGVTGTSLQTTLTGTAGITLTNASIQLVGRKARLLIIPIAVLLGLDELAQATVNGLNAQLSASNGKVQLAQCEVLSDAFIARAVGEIQIAPVLTDSRLNDLPINFALRRSLAQKARLIAQDAEPNAAFVTLPVFAKVGGTIAKPEVKTDKLVIAGLIAKTASAVPGLAGEKAGAILQGVGGLLTGQVPGITGPTTNQPATNVGPQKPVLPFNPLDLLKKR